MTETHYKGQLAYFLINSVADEPIGVWSVECVKFFTAGSNALPIKKGSRVSFKKLKLLWFKSEESKPIIRPEEPEILNSNINRLAFSYEQLTIQFQEVIKKRKISLLYCAKRCDDEVLWHKKQVNKLSEAAIKYKEEAIEADLIELPQLSLE